MKRRIPRANRDVIRFVRGRRIRRLGGYTLWLLLFAFSAWFYNNSHQTYPPEKRMVGWRLALLMLAAAVVGFFIFQLWKFFSARGVEGRILRAELSHTYTTSEDPHTVKALNYDFRDHTYLIIQTDKGKKRRIRFEQKTGFYLYYYPGSYVCRFSELPYPICDPARRCRPEGEETSVTRVARRHHDDLSNGRMCAVCGHLNCGDQICSVCGLSLIDPVEIWNEKQNGRIKNKNA
jgi:hypothetical protein